jgi:serine/threonine protein kinase
VQAARRSSTAERQRLTPEAARSDNQAQVAKVAAEVGSTANQYQILAKLAVGGMAEIFLARGASVAGVERYCVLKRILRERASDAQLVQMFVDEARLAAQLQHPNIASVYDVGILGDSYFFTMEYVHGETIRSLLHRAEELRRPVPLACVLTIIAGAAAGLHHAHERNANDGRPLGIVHRDISPSNLMVSFEGNVKVVDFGVATAADRAVETRSGTVKGKISYLSPEQCRGTRVDRRSDLFSLGIVMWEMLTGTRLYRRASDFENMTAIVHETPALPSSLRREIPRAIDSMVLRLLAKSVGDRFQTAAEVVEAIEDASMRAGTILSTSAVSRLVRDLFGVRAEPWLELDPDTLPADAETLLIPNLRGLGAVNAGEAEPVSMLDLSSSSMAIETAEILASDHAVAPQDGVAAPAAAPLTAASSGAAPAAAAPSPPLGIAATAPQPSPPARAIAEPRLPPGPEAQPSASSEPIALPAVAPPPRATSAPPFESDTSLDATILTAPPAEAVASASSAEIALAESGSSARVLGNSTLLGVGAPAPSGTRDYSAVFQTPERIGPSLLPMPSPAGFAPSSMAAAQARRTRPRGWRMPWPLLAVVVLAGTIGVVIVALMMGEPSRSSAPATAHPGSAPPLPGDAGVRHAIRAGLGNDSALDRAGAPLDANSAQGSGPSDVERPDAGAVTTSGAAGDTGSSAEPRAAAAGSSPADAGAAYHRAGESSSLPASTPAKPPAPPPKAPAPSPSPSSPAGESRQVWLSKLYHEADYATIVQVCSGTKLTADIASVCVLAACQNDAAAKAKVWLSEVAKKNQNAVKTRCKELADVDLDGN